MAEPSDSAWHFESHYQRAIPCASLPFREDLRPDLALFPSLIPTDLVTVATNTWRGAIGSSAGPRSETALR